MSNTATAAQVHLLNDERGPVIETLIARTQRQVTASAIVLIWGACWHDCSPRACFFNCPKAAVLRALQVHAGPACMYKLLPIWRLSLASDIQYKHVSVGVLLTRKSDSATSAPC